nr:hypothetical protein [uncultured Ilyobacter sp.]
MNSKNTKKRALALFLVLKKDAFSICIFMSVFSYFITCFFNDSVVSVAPLFWTLLAVGISLNEEFKETEI